MTKILWPVNQINFWNNVIFDREHTLLDLKWEYTLATTLDVQKFKPKTQMAAKR
jgi:hypothetical protein